MEPKYIFVKQRDIEGHFWGPTEQPSTYTNLRKANKYLYCIIPQNNRSATLAFEKNSAIEVAHDFSISLDILQYEYRFKQLRDFLQLMKLVQLITSFLAKPQC